MDHDKCDRDGKKRARAIIFHQGDKQGRQQAERETDIGNQTQESSDTSYDQGVAQPNCHKDRKDQRGRDQRDEQVSHHVLANHVTEPAENVFRIAVRARDGRRHEVEVTQPRGHPNNPMTDEEVLAKYEALASGALLAASRRAVVDFIWSLDRQPRVATLLDLLEGRPA